MGSDQENEFDFCTTGVKTSVNTGENRAFIRKRVGIYRAIEFACLTILQVCH